MEQTLLRPSWTPPVLLPRASRRRERRRLAARDRLSARLAELDTIGSLLDRAASRVQLGWCQDAWRSSDGAVCLVSAIRVSGPGPAAQVVSRALDVTWHALHDDPHGLGRVPPPDVRRTRVRDLTRWNDRLSRHRSEVVDLLRRSSDLAGQELTRLRASEGGRASGPGPRIRTEPRGSYVVRSDG